MTVDGVKRSMAKGKTGSISNAKPLTIAGKGTCDQITVTTSSPVRVEKG